MKVKLVTGLSYTTPSFSCKKGKAVTVSDELGENLMKTGRFEEVTSEAAADGEATAGSSKGSTKNGNDNNGTAGELTAEAIEKMKMPELTALADAKGIDISDCKNNDERADKIKGVLGLVNMSSIFREE